MAAVADRSETWAGNPEPLSPGRQAETVRPEVLGPVGSGIRDLILGCNQDGMESLKRGQLKAAFEQFKYAEAILLANQMESDNTGLLAVTCNNLGCYYKKVGKFHGALSYLRRALKMEIELKTDGTTLAGTHLNLCAILSKLEKHDKAVQHALCALELMSQRISQSDTVMQQDDYAVLAIAYHNVAMEREFLEQWDQAATAFQTGYQVAKRLLGANHPLSITLGKNCEAVLKKGRATKVGGGARSARSSRMGETSATPDAGGGGAGSTSLPPIASFGGGGASPSGGGGGSAAAAAKDSMAVMGKLSAIRSEADDWVKSEEAAWNAFAQKTLRPVGAAAAAPVSPTQSSSALLNVAAAAQEEDSDDDVTSFGTSFRGTQPLSSVALRDLQDAALAAPQTYDMGGLHFEERRAPRKQQLKKTPLGQALDDHPEALMDIIDGEGDSHPTMRSAPHDFRPNRSMKRSTRTSRVVRRTGVFNSMTHRDRVEADLQKKRAAAVAPWKSAHAQKLAAERIQRVWRSWYAYCQENSEWMTITWICATMIQSYWRSYHVRRQRMDRKAGVIQRHCRGFLVRCVLRSHTAAVTIQRRVVGVLTRKKLQRLHDAAVVVQRHGRRHLEQKHYQELRRFKFGAATTIQSHVRAWIARSVVARLRRERRHREVRDKATTDMQRYFRGWKGRQVADRRREEYLRAQREHEAARRIQTIRRAQRARRQVEELRALRLQEMEKAATFVRKLYLGARTKRRYRALRDEFQHAEGSVVTIQRYMRGCLCRLKLWREAVRTEEQLWAAVEVQRAWRGYRGRVAYENHYEHIWRREMGAALLQRNVRGFLARNRINRVKRRMARAEFEKARERFRAAARVQTLVRGVLSRKVTRARHARAVWAATNIQRVARGRALRRRMWDQVIDQRATMITAVARGFLVRRRKLQLVAKVICIQRAYRRWLRRPKEEREQQYGRMRRRKEQASKLQQHYRRHLERKEVKRIQGAVLGV